MNSSCCFLQLYVRSEGRGSWSTPAPTAGRTEYAAGDVPQLYASSIGDGKHRQLADFDEHLDDLSRDWTNSALAL